MKGENNMYHKGECYLFVYFTGESKDGEQIYFSISKDGLHWQDLNKWKPVLRSQIGECGVRDPFILHSVLDENYYILGTDLRIASGKGWHAAQYEGSTQMFIWQSKDLLHWSGPWGFSVGIHGAGCVWAPEAVYDPKEKAYLVFWASKVKEPSDENAKHRIYCSYTKDFHHFTSATKYIERSHDVIDTTIVEENGIFYRFSKDETTKNIRMESSQYLQGGFEEIDSDTLHEKMGLEGPAAFPLKTEGEWCLMVDQFAKGLGYLPLYCNNLKGGNFKEFEPSAYDMGENRKRHGSVLPISEQQYQSIQKYWD